MTNFEILWSLVGVIGLIVAYRFATRKQRPQEGRRPHAFGQISIVLAIISGLAAVGALSMDTTVMTGDGQQVYNLGLLARQQGEVVIFGFLTLCFTVSAVALRRR
jgi:hypothetical protein